MSQTDIPTGSVTTIGQYRMSAVGHPVVHHDCRPTERAQYISEIHKDKENRQHQQANKAHEHQEKACQKASKAAEREAYQNGCTRQYISIFVFFVLSHSSVCGIR
ncbi:hypothetical protein EDB19DRAFT_1829296 [Suillus lakei]|nr:hypothetical protein EDB19DRAFT_1829296 [Suillus lakei]